MKTIVALFVLFAAAVMADDWPEGKLNDLVYQGQAVLIPPGAKHAARVRRQTAAACPTQSTLTAAQQTETVNIHNTLRAAENTGNELQMNYNSDLAGQAQAWAAQCGWNHGGLTGCGAYTGQTTGQNLYVTSGSGAFPTLNMTQVALSWDSERNNWNFATGTCASGQVCGHWSQLVWARSAFVGCGAMQCSNMNVGGSVWQYALFVVCDYMNPGNMAGMPVMLPGAACSNCDSDGTGQGYKCVANLCQACAGPGSDPACTCGIKQTCVNGGTWNANTCQCTCPKGWYGLTCQNSCTCADLDPEGCPIMASPAGGSYCTNPPYQTFMCSQCASSCKAACGPCIIPAGVTSC